MFSIFREKSNRGHPFVSFKRLLAFSFLCGQGKVTVKVKGKGKRRGNPSFCRRSASHGHSIETGVLKVCLNTRLIKGRFLGFMDFDNLSMRSSETQKSLPKNASTNEGTQTLG